MSSKSASPYESLPPRNYWRKAVALNNVLSTIDLWFKKFDIDLTENIVSAGSCFAQHISRRLVRSGYKFLDYEPAPSALPSSLHTKYGYSTYSARYGNIYTTTQLLQIVEEAMGLRPSLDYSWERCGKFFDPLRPGVEPDGLDSHAEVIQHRKYHIDKVLRLIEACDVFVFTLGLTEAWICNRSGRILPTAPGTIAGTYVPSEYSFKNFTHAEIKSDFVKFMELVHTIQRRTTCKFLLTVSPVPLTATVSDNHVLVATTYSKSTLRSVAGELFDEFNLVDYYPSYEIINSPWSRGLFFESNQRSISSAGVDAAMRVFFLQHNKTKPELSYVNDQASPVCPDSQDPDDDVVCEDALLESFSK